MKILDYFHCFLGVFFTEDMTQKGIYVQSRSFSQVSIEWCGMVKSVKRLCAEENIIAVTSYQCNASYVFKYKGN